MIENRLLNYFLTLAQEQSYTKASKKLFISQAALSKQMSDLEKKLGIKLFYKTSRKTLLTAEGEIFRQKAQSIINLVNRLDSDYSTYDNDLSGAIYIGYNESSCIDNYFNIIKEFQAANNNLKCHFVCSDSPHLLSLLENHHLDFCILLEPIVDTKFSYTKVSSADALGLLMLDSHPFASKEVIDFKDLLTIPLLLPERMPASFLSLLPSTSILNVTNTFNTFNCAPRMVEHGLGSAIFIDKQKSIVGRNQVFRPIAPPILLDSYIVTLKDAPINPTAELLARRLS